MAVIITNMDMPKSCAECKLRIPVYIELYCSVANEDDKKKKCWVVTSKRRAPWCPLAASRRKV